MNCEYNNNIYLDFNATFKMNYVYFINNYLAFNSKCQAFLQINFEYLNNYLTFNSAR